MSLKNKPKSLFLVQHHTQTKNNQRNYIRKSRIGSSFDFEALPDIPYRQVDTFYYLRPLTCDNFVVSEWRHHFEVRHSTSSYLFKENQYLKW
mgnify:CR=1 FL=1